LKTLKNPFLMEFLYSFQDEDKVYFVAEFIDGVELFHHLIFSKRFEETRARFHAAELVAGLEYLHSLNLMYRAIKPENMYLRSDGHICITNFALVKELRDGERTGTLVGTPIYLAPEVLLENEYDNRVDWYGLGVLIYEMLVGVPPFQAPDIRKLYHKILTEKLNIPKFLSPEATSLIKSLMERDYNARLTDITKIKAHPFFSGIDWKKIAKKEASPPYIPDAEFSEQVASVLEGKMDLQSAGLGSNLLNIPKLEEISAEDQKKFEGLF